MLRRIPGTEGTLHMLRTRQKNEALSSVWGFPGGSDGKESACNVGESRFDPWV